MKQSLYLALFVLVFFSTSCKQENKSIMNPIDNILNQQIEKSKTPGVQYYFFDQDSIIYSYLGGFADIENNKKVTDQSTFAGYSTTKTFTALAIMQLIEKGKIQLDDPVADYVSDLPYPETITIKQLLAHSAGIPNPMPLKWIHTREEHDTFDRDAFFSGIYQKYNKVRSEPNEKFAYSNLGYVLLGQLIEETSGLGYEEYIRQNILDTLGLSENEIAFVINDPAIRAKGYQKKISLMNLMLGIVMDKSKFVDKTEGKWISFKEMYMNGPAHGGLIGSGSAFVRYLQELLKTDNCLISDQFKPLLFTENILNNGKPSGMCLSWFTSELNGNTYYTHAGGGAGFYCEIRIYPELDKGSVIMFNRSGVKAERFLDNLDNYLISD